MLEGPWEDKCGTYPRNSPEVRACCMIVGSGINSGRVFSPVFAVSLLINKQTSY